MGNKITRGNPGFDIPVEFSAFQAVTIQNRDIHGKFVVSGPSNLTYADGAAIAAQITRLERRIAELEQQIAELSDPS